MVTPSQISNHASWGGRLVMEGSPSPAVLHGYPVRALKPSSDQSTPPPLGSPLAPHCSSKRAAAICTLRPAPFGLVSFSDALPPNLVGLSTTKKRGA